MSAMEKRVREAFEAAKRAALTFGGEDEASKRELAQISSCRPFGVRRLVDSTILFASLRSFLASDPRLVALCRKRPGVVAGLPVAAFLALGLFQDTISFTCYLPAFASASALGVSMREAYSQHSQDPYLEAVEYVATLPIAAAGVTAEERLERRAAIQEFLKKRGAERRLARQKQPALPALQPQLQQGEQGEWAEPGFSGLGDSAEVFSIREEVGAGATGGAYDSTAWGEDAGAASPPEPSRGGEGAAAGTARGAADSPEAFSFFPSGEPSPFDALFPPPLEGTAAGAPAAPAPQLHDRPRRPSHVERRERRERLLGAGEERAATLR